MSNLNTRLKEALLDLVPADGTSVGNAALRRDADARLQSEGLTVSEADYWQAHADLVAAGALLKGQERGGSVRRAGEPTGDFSLAEQVAPQPEPAKPKTQATAFAKAPPAAKRATDRRRKSSPTVTKTQKQSRGRHGDTGHRPGGRQDPSIRTSTRLAVRLDPLPCDQLGRDYQSGEMVADHVRSYKAFLNWIATTTSSV